MAEHLPIPMVWDGEALRPKQGYGPRAGREYAAGKVYLIAPVEERSRRSERHYFVTIREAWQNLPQAGADRFPSPEALRKYALIKTGYRDERSIACSSKAEAQRVASFIKPLDDFAIITVNEAMVTVFTAKSQAERAMGARVFQESKTAVLEFIAGLLGVTVDELSAAGANA